MLKSKIISKRHKYIYKFYFIFKSISTVSSLYLVFNNINKMFIKYLLA